MSKLSILAIVLGLGVGLPQIYGLTNPTGLTKAARQFPRSTPWGVALMLLATAWFRYYLSQESISDFAAYREVLFALFAGVGIGSCIFVRDFLAVRGLAVVLLLLAKLMVDTGRPYLSQTGWVLLIQTWAYVFVVAGMWLTISPWRLRDVIEWDTANEKRVKLGCALRMGFGLFVALLGLTVFRTLP